MEGGGKEGSKKGEEEMKHWKGNKEGKRSYIRVTKRRIKGKKKNE